MTEPDPPTPPPRGTPARAAVTSALRAVRPDGLTHRRVRPFMFRADSRPVALTGTHEAEAPEVGGPLAPRPFVPVAHEPVEPTTVEPATIEAATVAEDDG